MSPVRFTVQGPMSQEFTQYSFDAHITLPGIIYQKVGTWQCKFKKYCCAMSHFWSLKKIIALNIYYLVNSKLVWYNCIFGWIDAFASTYSHHFINIQWFNKYTKVQSSPITNLHHKISYDMALEKILVVLFFWYNTVWKLHGSRWSEQLNHKTTWW